MNCCHKVTQAKYYLLRYGFLLHTPFQFSGTSHTHLLRLCNTQFLQYASLVKTIIFFLWSLMVFPIDPSIVKKIIKFKSLYINFKQGKTFTFGQVKQFANFECQLKIYESLYLGRICFIINVHVVKDWKISFITSERTIPLPKNKNRISYTKTTLLWPVFLSMANEVPIFNRIGCIISPDSTFVCFVLKLA